MPIRLIHLVDEHTREDGARLCSLLLRRLPAADVTQQVILMGQVPAGLRVPSNVSTARVARPVVWPLMWARPLQQRLARERPDAIIAWSAVAHAAAGWLVRTRTCSVISDPADARDAGRWSRVLGGIGPFAPADRSAAPGGLEFICTSGTIQRRLVEAGHPITSSAVIRPGVDFAEIRRARETMSRAGLGLPPSGRVLLVPSPASRTGGQFQAVWAAAMLHHIRPDTRLIVPGLSREQRRIARLVESIGRRHVYLLTAEQYSPAELMVVADALIVPALGDVPTDWLAWAMAAGVPVIGSAVPSVAEFVADRGNGFLCRPGEPHTLAVRIRTAFESPEAMAQCVQTARHQAYETFRAEACVQEFLKVVRSLAGGQPALAGVRDTAIDA